MSPSAVTPPPRPVRPVLLLAVLCALVLGACTHTRSIPNRYGDSVREDFTQGCVEVLTATDGEARTITEQDEVGEPFTGEDARAVCECTYATLSGPRGLTYEEFRSVNDAREDTPEALPQAIQDMVVACVADPGSAPATEGTQG